MPNDVGQLTEDERKRQWNVLERKRLALERYKALWEAEALLKEAKREGE